jgi:hypothetical protein
MFNPEDLHLQNDENVKIHRDVMDKGEREKIIHHTNIKHAEHTENDPNTNQQYLINNKNDTLEPPKYIPKCKGHPPVSLPLLSSTTLPLKSPCSYVYPPHLCTISRDHTES